MQTLKFKTNINCGGCVAKAEPFFNAESTISEWNVDTSTADKILTVKGEKLDSDEIKELIKKAGFIIKDN